MLLFSLSTVNLEPATNLASGPEPPSARINFLVSVKLALLIRGAAGALLVFFFAIVVVILSYFLIDGLTTCAAHAILVRLRQFSQLNTVKTNLARARLNLHPC